MAISRESTQSFFARVTLYCVFVVTPNLGFASTANALRVLRLLVVARSVVTEEDASQRLAPVRSRGVDESFEQRPELAGAEEILRMPLDAEAERLRGILDGFDHAVRRRRADNEAGGDGLHRLMVAAVHLARVGVGEPLAHQAREQRILLEPHL